MQVVNELSDGDHEVSLTLAQHVQVLATQEALFVATNMLNGICCWKHCSYMTWTAQGEGLRASPSPHSTIWLRDEVHLAICIYSRS